MTHPLLKYTTTISELKLRDQGILFSLHARKEGVLEKGWWLYLGYKSRPEAKCQMTSDPCERDKRWNHTSSRNKGLTLVYIDYRVIHCVFYNLCMKKWTFSYCPSRLTKMISKYLIINNTICAWSELSHIVHQDWQWWFKNLINNFTTRGHETRWNL